MKSFTTWEGDSIQIFRLTYFYTMLISLPRLEIISEIQLDFLIFLWSGKSDKIKGNILIGDFSQGGIQMPHILSFCHALKFSCVKTLFDPLNHAGWKSLFRVRVRVRVRV